ncbi:MAG TPA: YfhO family protein [Candidatus Kapabacteria bacterium]|nr:YfhO family protein [Candidatus Kapabacteria bacterium]
MAQSKPTQQKPPFELKTIHAALFLGVLTALMFLKILAGSGFPWEDIMEQEIPYRLFAADCFRHGIFPFWNPYTFCGVPFFAQLQTAVLYPTNILLSFLISGGSLGTWLIQFFIVAHFWLAAFGMFYLCRNELKQSSWGALVAGITFGFSGIMITHFIHQGMIFQFAWLPWVFFCIMRGARVRETKWFILGGILLGASFHSGHPQITLYTFFALGILTVTMLAREWQETKNMMRLIALAGRSALLAVIAVGLFAVQYIPALAVADLSIRSDITYEFAATGSLQWQQLITLLIPKFFGSSQATQISLPFWLYGGRDYFVFWETCFYIGILPLILSFIGAMRGKKQSYRIYLIIIAVFALLFGLGSNFVVFPVFFQLPLFNKFRNPARIMYLFTLAAAIFAGRGFDILLEERLAADKTKKLLWQWLGIGVGVGLLLLAAGSSMFDIPEQVASAVSTQVWIYLFLWVASMFLVWLLRSKTASLTGVCVGIAVLLSVDLLIFGSTDNNGARDPKLVYNQSPEILNKLQTESRDQLFRVRMREGGYMLMERNQGPVSKIQLVEGYSPLVLQRHEPDMFAQSAQEDLMNVRYSISVDTARRTEGLVERQNYLPRACMFYQTKVSDDSGVIHALKVPFDYHHILYLEKSPDITLPDTSVRPTSSVRVTSYTPNEIHIDAETSENGILFTSEIFYPDWKAYVDGAPAEILRADACLRAVALQKGKHEIVFRYESHSFAMGAYISGGVLLLSIVSFAGLSLKKKKK